MSIKINALELVVATEKGPFGSFLEFDSGLCLIRAENTTGKSTCIQAVTYALGLEGMLSSTHEVPLPHAMTTSLEHEGKNLIVTEGYVRLQIENDAGEYLTIKRATAGENDRKLIQVVHGPALTKPSSNYAKEDYFVRIPGSAKREAGFHQFLPNFIGWVLPTLRNPEGDEIKLYMECMFPLISIEQKAGWAGIQAHMPTYRIPQMRKRAIEYLMDLDALREELKRQDLRSERDGIRQQWKNLIGDVYGRLNTISARATNISSEPSGLINIEDGLNIEIQEGSSVFDIKSYRAQLKSELDSLKKVGIRTIGSAGSGLEKELEEKQALLTIKDIELRTMMDSMSQQKINEDSVNERLVSLEQDLRRNKDVEKLRSMGVTDKLLPEGDHCPACHQDIPDVLIDAHLHRSPMMIEDNISFLDGQVQSFRLMKLNASKSLQEARRRVAMVRDEANSLRRDSRSLKTELGKSNDEPVMKDIERTIEIRQKLLSIGKVIGEVEDIFGELVKISRDSVKNSAELQKISQDKISDDDVKKLDAMTSSVRSQLKEYGFRSVGLDGISISKKTYKPTHDGYELAFVTSASDLIRIIWAYLTALLELARSSKTNHLGLMLFDEPKQQAASKTSLVGLWKRIAASKKYNQQVICTTSEDMEVIDAFAASNPCHIFQFDDWLLKPYTPKTTT